MSLSRPRIAAVTAFLAVCAVAVATVSMVPASADGGHAAGDSQARAAGASAQRAAGTELLLKMNGKKTKKRPGVTGLRNSGASKIAVRVVYRDRGRAKLVRGQRAGKAVRFPAFRARATSPKVAIRALPSGRRGNPLNPGIRDFTFGADFRLDTGTTETAHEDDGDNLMQRGQFNARTQYKIQLDKSRPECRIKGLAGEVVVKFSSVLPRNRWHRVRCTRDGEEVRLTVWQLSKVAAPVLIDQVINEDDDPAATRIGSVSAPRSRSLAIGGRLTNRNVVPRGHADQFNGVIDQVMVNIL